MFRKVFLALAFVVAATAFQPASAQYLQLLGAGAPPAGGGSGPPVNTSPPAITGMNPSGTADISQPLSCSSGTWTGAPTITYAYKYQRNGVDIPGAVTNGYTPTVDDTQTGTVLTCIVTATNGSGSVPATSNSVTAFHPYQIAIAYWDFEDTAKGTFGATATAWTSGGTAGTPITVAEVSGSGPTYSATAINGRPGITGNGTSMYLTATTNLGSIPVSSTPSEFFAGVNQPDAGSVPTTRVAFGHASNNTNSSRIRLFGKVAISSVSTLRAQGGTGSGTINSDLGPFLNLNTVHIVFGTNTVSAELNGVAGSVPTPTTLNAQAIGLNILASPVFVGSAPSSYSTMTFNGVGIYPALTTAQQNSNYYWHNARLGLP